MATKKVKVDRSQPSGLEEIIFGETNRKFGEALRIIMNMSNTERKLFLVKMNTHFFGNTDQDIQARKQSGLCDE
jgi:hypothetical protein